jgi:hypothetical protein
MTAGRPKKLTQNEAIKLGQELLAWLKEDRNIFMSLFLAEKGLSRQNLKDLQEYYPEFKTLVEQAKHLQEAKLMEMGAKNRINVVMALFCLKNHHGYADKLETKNENTNHTYNNTELKGKSDEELREMLLNLTSKPSVN